MRCRSLHAQSRSFLWDRHFCQRSPPLHVQRFFVSGAFDGGSLREPRGGGAAPPRTPSRFFKGSPPACAAARFTHKALSSVCFAGAFKVATPACAAARFTHNAIVVGLLCWGFQGCNQPLQCCATATPTNVWDQSRKLPLGPPLLLVLPSPTCTKIFRQ